MFSFVTATKNKLGLQQIGGIEDSSTVIWAKCTCHWLAPRDNPWDYQGNMLANTKSAMSSYAKGKIQDCFIINKVEVGQFAKLLNRGRQPQECHWFLRKIWPIWSNLLFVWQIYPTLGENCRLRSTHFTVPLLGSGVHPGRPLGQADDIVQNKQHCQELFNDAYSIKKKM